MQYDEWEHLTQFVGLFIGTGYVLGEHAQSVLLIGEPGVGKSAMVKRFAEVPSCKLVMDCTSDGLRKKLIPTAIERGHRHFLLPEIYKLFQRKAATSDNTVGMLSLMMSGELHDQFIGDSELNYPEGTQIGVIAGMPANVFADWGKQLMNTGVVDRMAMVAVKFSEYQRKRIEVAIATGDRRMTSPVPWRWPHTPIAVEYDGVKFGGPIMRIADIIQPKGDRNRLIAMLVSLAKSAAMMNGRNVVTKYEIDTLNYFMPHLKNMR